MQKAVLAISLCALILPGQAPAKPLLLDSQQTYMSACLAYKESHKRMRAICEQALDQPGASMRQRLDIMDSLAWANYYLGQPDMARQVFQRMLDLDSESEDGLTGMAWIAYDADDYGKAGDLFERAMNRSPSAQVLAGLGVSRFYGRQFDLDKALRYIDAALAIDPKYSWALRRKGWFLQGRHRLSESEKTFRQAVEVDHEERLVGEGPTIIQVGRS